jgi:hypothetical protein
MGMIPVVDFSTGMAQPPSSAKTPRSIWSMVDDGPQPDAPIGTGPKKKDGKTMVLPWLQDGLHPQKLRCLLPFVLPKDW